MRYLHYDKINRNNHRHYVVNIIFAVENFICKVETKEDGQ